MITLLKITDLSKWIVSMSDLHIPILAANENLSNEDALIHQDIIRVFNPVLPYMDEENHD